ncbi:MAG: AzlD domain-containing protein [Anaerolineales bacterium]|nr:AzlD domain-containing protein [Anaerolineales bacterium]
MNIWLVLLLGGLLTFGMRYSFIYLLGRFELPETLRRALRFVPPAVLSAIVIPELVIRSGQVDISLTNYRLLAGIVAILVAWKTKNTLLTILAGMVALLVLEFTF